MTSSGEVVATIFARNRASGNLLPGRSLIKLGGVSVLEHILRRLHASTRVDRIIVACTKDAADAPIEAECARLGIECFRGDETILHRIWEVIQKTACAWVVKVNGNYPLVDVQALDALVDACAAGGADLGYNGHERGVPYGMDCEVLGRSLFEKVDVWRLDAEDLESGTCFLRVREDLEVLRLSAEHHRPEYRLCLETRKDQVLLLEIFDRFPEPGAAEVLSLLDRNPALLEINRDVGEVKEIGVEKLCAFPEKLKGFLLADEVDFSYPVSVELSLTDRCNQGCVWCSDAGLRKRSNGELTLDQLKSLFDDLAAGGVQGVVLEGGGEPTLHPDFDQVVRALPERGLDVGLITNGVAPLRPELLELFSWIRVSLDASTPEEYRQLKRIDAFEKVLANIGAMVRSTRVCGVGYVVTNRNVGDIENLTLRLKSMGVSYVHFRPVIDHDDMRCARDLSFLHKYASSAFSVLLDAMAENRVRGNDALPCAAHSLTSVIAANGDVYICGRLNKYPVWPPIGNIRKRSFREIWRDGERRRQVRELASPAFCEAYCPECRITKFNVLIDKIRKIRTRSFI
jgi:radical SAM protein with 4Fe4S-binding SPASM domain